MAGSPRSFVALCAFAVSFVINPGYFAGCVASVPEGPDFGEAEMLELLDEANATGPFELEHDGVQYRLELTLAQKPGEDADESASRQLEAAFAARAYACGNRTFMASASACVTISTVPLTGRFSLVRLDPAGETRLFQDRPLDGQLRVGGDRLTNATVEVTDEAKDTIIRLASTDGVTIDLAQFTARIDGFPTTF
jgi:hypothetical protein